LGTAALSVYAVALVAYTLLPLPDSSTCVGRSGAILQPVPLATLTDIADLAATHGPTSSIALFAAAQPVLNVVLFVPLGVLVRAMAGRGITVATLTGLAVSVLVETTQYTGVFGLVGCAYRVAGVPARPAAGPVGRGAGPRAPPPPPPPPPPRPPPGAPGGRAAAPPPPVRPPGPPLPPRAAPRGAGVGAHPDPHAPPFRIRS